VNRLYLRMLISVPGNRIQEMLSYGDERVEEVNAPQYTNVSSLLHSPSAAGSQPRQPLLLLQVGAYIRLTRENSLLVRHSWSLVLYNTFQTGVDGGYKDVGLVGQFSKIVVEEVSEHPKEEMKLLKYGTDQEKGGSSTKGVIIIDNPSSSFEDQEGPHSEPVRRVMDARTSEILGILRQHFEEIPDFRNGLGVKINIRCQLRFMGETLQRMRAEADGISDSEDLVDVYSGNLEAWPAIYAVVISFTSTGLYGQIPSVHVPFLLSEAPERKLWQRPETESPDSVFADKVLKGGRGRQIGKGKAQETAEAYSVEIDDEEGHSQALRFEPAKDDKDIFSETVIIELEPRQPVPTLVDAKIIFSDEDGTSVSGQLDSIPVGIEDLFLRAPVPLDVLPHNYSDYYFTLFHALFEACSGPGRLGTETFCLKNSATQAGVSIESSESVKLLEGQADRVVGAVEQWLAPFVVAVMGTSLVAMARDSGVFKHAKFLEDEFLFDSRGGGRGGAASSNRKEGTQLRLEYIRDQSEGGGLGPWGLEESTKGGLGSFLVLIFLPPRYHLLLKMEVSDWSTLVRIRTDHWPCLAHVDEFLEALIMSR
jgi:AP-5 complex subunit beta-1